MEACRESKARAQEAFRECRERAASRESARVEREKKLSFCSDIEGSPSSDTVSRAGRTPSSRPLGDRGAHESGSGEREGFCTLENAPDFAARKLEVDRRRSFSDSDIIRAASASDGKPRMTSESKPALPKVGRYIDWPEVSDTCSVLRGKWFGLGRPSAHLPPVTYHLPLTA